MTLDPERALSAALLARLRADPGVASAFLGPARVYDAPPAEPDYPYLTIGRAESRPWGGLEGEGVEQVVTITCVSRYDGTEEAKRLNGLVRACLDDAKFPLEDHELINLRVSYADVFRASDWRSVYGVVRLRAVTEPLA